MKTCSTCYAYQGAPADPLAECANLDNDRGGVTSGDSPACVLWAEVVPTRKPFLTMLRERQRDIEGTWMPSDPFAEKA